MNAPNLLSIFRLFITFFFILAVYYDRLDYALYLFILQGVTDLLDGFIARVMSKKTNLGAYLDPIADKTMLVAAFIMLSIKDIVPVWLPALIILKDLIVAIGFLFSAARPYHQTGPEYFRQDYDDLSNSHGPFYPPCPDFLLVECGGL